MPLRDYCINQTTANHTSRGSSPESSAALAAFPRVQTLGLSAAGGRMAVCYGAAGPLPSLLAAPRGVSAVFTGALCQNKTGPAMILLIPSVGRGLVHLERTILSI